MAVEGSKRNSHPAPRIEVEIWSPPVPLVENLPARALTYKKTGSRFAVAFIVIAAHVLGLTIAVLHQRHQHSENTFVVPSILTVKLLTESNVDDLASLPDVTLTEVPLMIDIPSAPLIQLSDADEGTPVTPGIPFSAPRVEPGMVVEGIPFVPSARWPVGRRVTVILAVDVSANGGVADVVLERGTGDETVDATAVNHARKLRWIPGVLAGQPRQMRTRLVLTMKAIASA